MKKNPKQFDNSNPIPIKRKLKVNEISIGNRWRSIRKGRPSVTKSAANQTRKPLGERANRASLLVPKTIILSHFPSGQQQRAPAKERGHLGLLGKPPQRRRNQERRNDGVDARVEQQLPARALAQRTEGERLRLAGRRSARRLGHSLRPGRLRRQARLDRRTDGQADGRIDDDDRRHRDDDARMRGGQATAQPKRRGHEVMRGIERYIYFRRPFLL